MQEVRVAMALNGGVSLAVWMGGCAVELDRARRANRADGAEPRIYDALCECFGRRLVIDILTGASAGGINGALLSAAMVSGRTLDTDFVRKQWLELGDLADLLYPTTKDDPPALMDGDLFHERLLGAFKGVLGIDPNAPGFTECTPAKPLPPTLPSLDVTMTDVIGVEKKFRDAWGGELIAREHRPRFKFRERPHFSAEALATAARTSASFPIAFEPWPVKGDPRALAGLPKASFGIDGGLLDNAPIEAALDLIPTKPADSRVLRYICYLNGDPPCSTDEIPKAPTLLDVGGYTINLPRAAPFVDQLYAIQRAVERPQLAAKVQSRLLAMDIGDLRAVAGALFDSYRDRRTTQSLEELLEEPGDAMAMSELLLNTDGRLPWIPLVLEPTSRLNWRWGIRPAQRILHLLLDALRPKIPGTSGKLREELLDVRAEIDRQLSVLGEAREHVVTPGNQSDPARFSSEAPLEKLQKAVSRAQSRAAEAYDAVWASAEALHGLLERQPDHFASGSAARLFAGDPTAAEGDWASPFFLRVLSIEVIRRAFSNEADIESSEELRFVQLTPAAPTPIFTSGPLRLPSPASAGEKLAGVGLGHFAGFFRSSWRANDFMWGRLDAAARIVDLLLDKPSDEVGLGASDDATQARERSAFLADALLPEDDPGDAVPSLEARRWLLEEALDDATAADGAPPATKETDGSLKARVRARIEAELLAATPDSGVNKLPFTRAVFQRAAQLEIAAVELPVIRERSGEDRKLGAGVKPFLADAKGKDVIRDVKAVRDLYEAGDSLPSALTDSEEAVSDLGLRTITHAAFVALSAVQTAGAPLAKFFGVVRTPLSAIAATVAKNPLYRGVAGLGFWAAAVYLTTRLVTTSREAPLEFSAVWSWATLTALVAAVGILGIAAVPILRLWRGVQPFRNLLTTAGLLGFAFVFAVILAAAIGELDTERILFTPEAENPPNLVLLAPLFALGLISAARLPLPGGLSKIAVKLEEARADWVLSCLLPAIAFLLLGIWTGIDLWNAGFDGGRFWQAASAAFALFATPIVATLSLTRWRRSR